MCSLVLAAAAALGLAAAPPAVPPAPAQAGSAAQLECAARAPGATLSWERLDQLLVDRWAMSPEGRDTLRHLLRAHVLDRLAAEAGLVIGDAAVDERVRELERQVRSAGEAPDLGQYLRENHLSEDVFRTFLRRGMVQEALARRALGIPGDRPVPPEQQEMWLDQILEQRGTSMPPPPWPDGVAARCGDLTVSAADYRFHLRTQLPAEDVREACFQLLLLSRIEERMPDLAPEAAQRAVQAEIDRRRAEVAADPRYQGASYEQLLAARGSRLDRLPHDPAVRVPALAELWVDRTHGEDGLRRAYREERAWFDGRFGPAVRARAIFLRAARLTNPLNPRSFEEAQARLQELAQEVQGEDSFAALAGVHSEDPESREHGGDIGPVTRADPRLPDEVCAALFDRAQALAAGAPDGRSPRAAVVGPLQTPGGSVLLWAGELREAPPWEEMRGHVRRELERRFLEECLARESVTTFLDTID